MSIQLRSLSAALLAGLLFAGACVSLGDSDGEKRFPTSRDFPASMMTRTSLSAGGGLGWTLSALYTPDRTAASWKIVVVTGTPSWPEYWAPTLAKIGPDREMIVADRPGFALSQPARAVTSIEEQAQALAAMLDAPPGQKVVLIGQSYGGPVATLMAAEHPDKVRALVLMSAFFGEPGPTAKRLDALGSFVRPLLPRDLKNSLAELKNQKPQLPAARAALAKLDIPIVVLHGDKDTFVEPPAAARLAGAIGARAQLVTIAGGDHFLNACCVPQVLEAVELGIARADAPGGGTTLAD